MTMWNRFAPRLRRAVFDALELAGRAGADQASAQDLLATVLLDSQSAASFILDHLGLSPSAAARELSRPPAPGSPPRERAIRLSPDALHLLDVARGESDKSNDDHVGSEHLLKALLQINSPLASIVLKGRTVADIEAAIGQWIKLGMPRQRDPLIRWVGKSPAMRRLGAPLEPILRMPVLAYRVYIQKSLGHPGFIKDPYPLYAKLRNTRHVRKDPVAPVWVLTRYADVAAYLRDPRMKKDPFCIDVLPEPAREQLDAPDESAPGFMPQGPQSMLFLDPPRHTRIRGLFNKAFTPRTLERLRPRIEQIAARRLDRVQHSGQMDLIRDLAYPLPTVVIAELLGFPPEDYERLKKWSDDFAATLSFNPTPQKARLALKSREDMRIYFDQVVARLRAQPQDNLISALLAAELDQSRLSAVELFANCVLLMAAGHETTTNLIGNGILALLRHPQQLEMLRANPALIGTAIEELLRYDSPVQWTSRIAAEKVVIGGKEIPRGEMVVASLGAANRDPAQFVDPDRLDITRTDNRHLAFGAGIHFCLGAALAKMEGEISIGMLVDRFKELRLARQKLKWRPGGVFRGLEALVVRWG